MPCLKVHHMSNAIMTVNATKISLPSGMGMEEKTDARGRSRGLALSFIGEKSASQLKEEGKKLGLKGDKLKMFVNKSLNGDKDAAWLRHDALLSAMRSSGVVPVVMATNKAGNVFKSEYRLVEDTKDKEAVAAAEERAKSAESKLEALKKALLAKGCSEEEIQATLGL